MDMTILRRSPSGAACPYYYKGGEMQPLEFGSYHDDAALLFAIIDAEQAFILKSPGQHNRRIWIDLYETTLTEKTVEKIVAFLIAIEPKICRLSLVGCTAVDRFHFRCCMRKRGFSMRRQVVFFSDPEDAKDWLVGEAASPHDRTRVF